MPEIIEPGKPGSRRRLEMVITKEELAEAEARVVKTLSKRVKVPGFRPGNVPPAVVRARFGEMVAHEALDDAVNEKVRHELSAVGARPLGQVIISDIKKEEDGSIRLTVEYETIPEVTLPELSRITVEKRVLTISDVDILEQLEAIQKSLATTETVERGIREGDHIVAEMTEFDPNGDVTFTGKVGIRYNRDELDPYLFDELGGKKVGDECDISVVAENEKGENEERKQHYKVLEVRELRMPELDDEFAKSHGHESLDEMKEEIRKALEARIERELELDFEWKIIRAIYDSAPFDIPESLVARRYEGLKDQVEIQSADGGELPEEQQREQIMRFAADLVKRELILAAAIREFSVEETEGDLEKEIAEEAEDRKMAPEKLRKQAEKSGDIERIRYVARLKKAMDFLKEAVHTEIVFQ